MKKNLTEEEKREKKEKKQKELKKVVRIGSEIYSGIGVLLLICACFSNDFENVGYIFVLIGISLILFSILQYWRVSAKKNMSEFERVIWILINAFPCIIHYYSHPAADQL